MERIVHRLPIINTSLPIGQTIARLLYEKSAAWVQGGVSPRDYPAADEESSRDAGDESPAPKMLKQKD